MQNSRGYFNRTPGADFSGNRIREEVNAHVLDVDGDDDLDLYVYDAAFDFVGGSGSFTSAEQVDIVFPTSPVYFVAVHGWQTDGPDAEYVLFDFSVSATPGGSLMIDYAPPAAATGVSDAVDVSWAGLDPETKYMGAVSHADGGGLIGLSVIRVDTD